MPSRCRVETSTYSATAGAVKFQRVLKRDQIDVRVVPAPTKERFFYQSALELVKLLTISSGMDSAQYPILQLPGCEGVRGT